MPCQRCIKVNFNSLGCPTEKASWLTALSSYIQDTWDMLKAINGIQVPTNAWLVMVDGKALNSSIAHKQINVVASFLQERKSSFHFYNSSYFGVVNIHFD